jgi:hypothetical protein
MTVSLPHEKVWASFDALAAKNGWSVSRLAINAGMDATSFNESKRTYVVEGVKRGRWPSTETVSRVLDATGTTPEEWITLVRSL